MTRHYVAYELRLILFFALGLGLACLRTFAASPSLSDALDNTNLVWQTGGTQPWIGETTLTHDGIDAANSGGITNNQESWIQASALGPGPLSFWWKVSSEDGFDFLRFFIDDVEQVTISGEVGWEQRSFDLAPGRHTLKWRYSKDPSESNGSDRAWLDQVSYVPPFTSAPEIVTQPSNQTVAVGATVSFSVTAYGVPEPTYRWRFNGSAISAATNSTLTLTNVGTNQSGFYSVIVSNFVGFVTSDPALLTVTPIGDALDATLGATQLVWTVGGDAPWLAETSVTHDGVDAAVSGTITNSEQSWVQTMVNGPGLLSFWWKVSSEAFYDGLQFLTNGVAVVSLSGEAQWEKQTVYLPRGLMTLRWRYFKDPSITTNQDKGWLDEVNYVPNRAPTGLNLSLDTPVINEMDSVTVTGSFADLDGYDSHKLLINWGDGSPSFTTNLAVAVLSFSARHQYRDDTPTGTASDTNFITVAVWDEAGTNSATVPLRVNNIPPLLRSLFLTTPIFSNDVATLIGGMSDLSLLDSFQLRVNWGDGSAVETNTYPTGTNSFRLGHRYTLANTTVLITLTLLDDDNGSVTVTTNLVIGPIVAQPRLTLVRTNASLRFRLEGSPQANYQIQASEDFTNWTTLMIGIPASNNLMEFETSDQLRYWKRYYRAKWESQSIALRLMGITQLANGHLRITAFGQPGSSCRLQTSTNMHDWSDWDVVTVGSNGLAEFDEPSPSGPRRFYRAAQP